MERKIVYFEKAGNVNTTQTLTLAKERVETLGIKTVVLASSSGATAQRALEVFKNTGVQLIVVGTSRQSFRSELFSILEREGVLVRFSSEVPYSYPEAVMNAFRKLSEGMKVVMDLGMIIREEGLATDNEEVVAIGGTGPLGFEGGGGVDTAVVIVPRGSEAFNTLPAKKEWRREIKEIICKPR